MTPPGLTSRASTVYSKWGRKGHGLFKCPRGSRQREQKQCRSYYFRPGNQAVPDNEPNWDLQDIEEAGERHSLSHYKNMILNRIQAAGKKPVNWNKRREINQRPTENPLAFLEHLREYLRIYSTTDPESLGGNVILKSYFISQSAPEIRCKCQKLEIESDTRTSCLLEVAYWVFHN